MTLRVTLVTDGTSDVVLLPILEWWMRQLTRRLSKSGGRISADSANGLASWSTD